MAILALFSKAGVVLPRIGGVQRAKQHIALYNKQKALQPSKINITLYLTLQLHRCHGGNSTLISLLDIQEGKGAPS